MLYLELLAADSGALLTKIREFNTAETGMDYLFEPGKMDVDLAGRFAELIDEFEHAEQKQGRLVTESGCLMFHGALTCLARVSWIKRGQSRGKKGVDMAFIP
jgi:cytochrome c